MSSVQGKARAAVRARLLVVDDEPALLEVLREAAGLSADCQVLSAASVSEAAEVLSREEIDLLITDMLLPDGSGLSLLPQLQRVSPGAAALVVTGLPSMDGAIDAMRLGAVDFLPKPFSVPQLAQRIEKALAAQRHHRRREWRMQKLRKAFHRLNLARRTVSKKVDLLCNDLIGAYGDLSRQLDSVRIQQGFQRFIERASGLEQLLCHSMDWMLRQVGYCNIGIWLAAEQDLQLGAYMKYTIAAEQELTEALGRNLLPMAARRGFVRLRDAEARSHLTPGELKHLSTQDIVAVNCTYLSEVLGVMVLFRDAKTPFSDDDVSAIKSVAPLFALALARAARGNSADADEGATLPEEPKKKGKKDPADWWKNGEAPPF